MNLLRVLWEDFKAWRRGEYRVAPRTVTGRVYARRSESQGAPAARARSRPRARMIIRVYRAATGTWEDPVVVPSEEE